MSACLVRIDAENSHGEHKEKVVTISGGCRKIAVLAAGDVVHAAIALCWLQRAGHTCPIGRRSPI